MSLKKIENINALEPLAYKAVRKRLGLSQRELAELLGLTRHAVQMKETGRTPISKMDTLTLSYLESVIDREELLGVADSLQAACVAVERYASNAKLRALETPIVDILANSKPVGSTKGGAA